MGVEVFWSTASALGGVRCAPPWWGDEAQPRPLPLPFPHPNITPEFQILLKFDVSPPRGLLEPRGVPLSGGNR